MKTLQEPSQELAQRILSELEFKDRFQCHRIHRRAGFVPITCYAFEEIVCYLVKGSLQINTGKLMTWIGEALGDMELAERIGEIIQAGIRESEKLRQINTLMITRLGQAKKVLLK